jgi:DNA-binding NtrC family response regulator
MKRSILVVDDDPTMREMVQDLLEARSFEVATAPSAEDAIELARDRSFDAVLTDLQMPEMDGLGLLGSLRDLHPELPVILMTSFGSIQTAVAAMQAGAHDYVTKPFETESLLLTVERALEKRDLQEENRRLRAAVDRTASFGDLVGKSGAMNERAAHGRERDRQGGRRPHDPLHGQSR